MFLDNKEQNTDCKIFVYHYDEVVTIA